MRRLLPPALALTLGCGSAAAPEPPADASAAPPVSAAGDGAPEQSAATLARKATPRERRLEDERACDAGDAGRCRRAADRYRGYGHIAGCGVDRGPGRGSAPRRAVTAADAPGDARHFDTWIRKACDLGDEDACLQGKQNVASPRVSERVADACARSGLGDCPLYQWVLAMRPYEVGGVLSTRRQLMSDTYGGKLFDALYRREKTRGGDLLPASVSAIAERICKETLECDDVFMMLDKNGYTANALAPLRGKVGEALASACLEGECVCGEAARYLDGGDPRLLELARMGAGDGEPDAMFVLGDLHDRGWLAAKSPTTAFGLYEAACPAELAADDREEQYSKLACARLAERYEEGESLEKDAFRGYYYASAACPRGGFERDHAPCLRRGLMHARYGFKAPDARHETPRELARRFFFGSAGSPVDGKECERPSVAALCERDEGIVR